MTIETIFYVFDQYGEFQFIDTDEHFVQIWCDEHDGFYSYDEE